MDYACRDVWASGYCTSNIDLRRLISALHIKRKGYDYIVCFESNSLNEIESVLNVKDFQSKFVINHHTVVYEQYLLQQAAECAALYFFPDKKEISDDNPGFTALKNIVNVNAIIGNVKSDKGDLTIKRLSDDDLIFLMKQTPDNSYYEEWSSRNFKFFALWKSKDEFHHYFPNAPKTKTLKNNRFKEIVFKHLAECGYNKNDIRISEVKFKCRIPLESLYLVVANDVASYAEIKNERHNDEKAKEDIVFYYVFISKKKCKNASDIINERKKIVGKLKNYIENMYN